MAMPREYASASAKPLARPTGPVCPAISELSIGSIGRTQGVNDSSRPASQKTPSVWSRFPEASAALMVSMVAGAVARTGAAALCAATSVGGSGVICAISLCRSPLPLRESWIDALAGA